MKRFACITHQPHEPGCIAMMLALKRMCRAMNSEEYWIDPCLGLGDLHVCRTRAYVEAYDLFIDVVYKPRSMYILL